MSKAARSYVSLRAKANRGRRASRESSLHRTLKERYAGGGYVASTCKERVTEVTVDGFRIDVVHPDQLIEIQTRNFSSIKRKLCALLASHSVRLVYPIPCEKWVVHVEPSGEPIKRRKSPKRGCVLHVFDELISFPHLMAHPNLSLNLPDPFTSRDLATAMSRHIAFARRVTYCLRKMNAIRVCGRRGWAFLYRRISL